MGIVGSAAVNITSIVHAVKGAQKVNRARGFALGENINLNIQPTIIPQKDLLTGKMKYNTYGINVCVNF